MEGYLQLRRLQRQVQQPCVNDDRESKTPDDEITHDSSFVDFGPDDAANPRNWSTTYKILCTCMVWNLVFVTGWASSADATAHEVANKTFHVSEVAESLSTSMYLFGVGAGALLAGPCSETLGRLLTYLSTFAVFLVWVMASALAPNFAAQIVFRLFAGVFGSASMSIYGGTLADLFDTNERAVLWPFFALAPLLGPVIAPIASGWIVDCAGWRWVDWTTLIISGASFLLALLLLPETFAPVILSQKARLLRRESGNTNIKAKTDEGATLSGRLSNNLRRIGYFICREPTTLLFGLYITLLYLLIFGFLEGFDYIFSQTYRFNVGYRYAAFGAVAVGTMLGLPFVVCTNHYLTRTPADSTSPAPEQRLKPTILASALLPISLFWIGWTDRVSVSYWSPIGACCLFGFALNVLFTSTYHYLIDSYGTNAASALAAVTFIRYLASGGMVLATEPLYRALSVKWMLTLLGCVAALLAPVPWVFAWKGSAIRNASKYAQAQG